MHDSGGKFIQEKAALQCLADHGCDICIYSFTPQGHTAPVHLIVKMTMPGCMDTYWSIWKTKPHERCAALEIVDYEGTNPA